MADQDDLQNGQNDMKSPLEPPVWLSRSNLEKAAEKNAGQTDSQESEKPGHPEWLKNLIPEGFTPETKSQSAVDDQTGNKDDPLADLQGVLHAGSSSGLPRSSKAVSLKLQTSGEQRRYATYLERLVAGESHPHPGGTVRRSPSRLWRWLITALVFLAVGLPFMVGIRVPTTKLSSTDQGASARLIEDLPDNIPVLVAFDYDPALSGELEAVGVPVMYRIFSRKIPLALISTSPTGPALAEHFIQTASLANGQEYSRGEQYINLGYLAGGPAGMSSLSQSLMDALPVEVSGGSAWTSGLLQGIHELGDFAAIIILTDNPDTGRNWIEQAGLRVGDAPMLMITSAQALPLLRPYLDSSQLSGLVSGLSDAKIYEQTYDHPGLAQHYWDSFSVGTFVAEFLIVAGSIAGVIANIRARRKDIREKV